MKKILIVFGTRPEAIKMAPVITEFKKHSNDFLVRVCVTAQHREMLDQILDFFQIVPDYDLNIMSQGQSLSGITATILNSINPVFEDFSPDLVLVHGDTATTMSSALAAFYLQIPVGHVEAGLRSYDKFSPFPEEVNRNITTLVTRFHFAPTILAAENLKRENIQEKDILITGNTVIDALLNGLSILSDHEKELIPLDLLSRVQLDKKILLVTAHRRENLGEGFENMTDALLEISRRNDVQIIIPMHLNPKVRNVILSKLSDNSSILLIEPQSYPVFLWLMKVSYLILTDSGGIQEEAPTLHKPVLVMRDTTERPEGIKAGVIRLIGTSVEAILKHTVELLENIDSYHKMASNLNPYGDGKASEKLVNFLKKNL